MKKNANKNYKILISIFLYLINVVGFTFSPFFKISKCKCGGSEISKLALSPIVPMV